MSDDHSTLGRSLDSKIKFIQEKYARLADEYAALRDEKIWRARPSSVQLISGICEIYRPHRILELAVGTGRYFPYLHGSRYVGVDVSPSMLDHARRRETVLRERGFAEIEFVQSEIETFLSHPSEVFDFVLCVGCIGRYVPITNQLMRQLSEILEPGGNLFLETRQRSCLWRVRKLESLLGHSDEQFFVPVTLEEAIGAANKSGLSLRWVLEEKEQKRRWGDRRRLMMFFQREGQSQTIDERCYGNGIREGFFRALLFGDCAPGVIDGQNSN